MTNIYIPKNICSNCNLEIWDYNEDKDSVICKKYNPRTKKNTGCGNGIKKKLHNLIGATISKNEKGQYVLAFPEYKETSIYPDWKDLQEAMNELAKNDEQIKELSVVDGCGMEACPSCASKGKILLAHRDCPLCKGKGYKELVVKK